MSHANPVQVALGTTYHKTRSSIPTDFGTTVSLEGSEMWFDNFEPSFNVTKTERNQKKRKFRFVRNSSGGALLPGANVSYEALFHGRRVDALLGVGGEYAGTVDENLPAAGVADDDLFWICLEGETLIDKVSTDTIADGDYLRAGASGEAVVDISELEIALTTGKVFDALATDLPTAATGNDMGIIGAPGSAAPTLQGVDFGGATTDEKASFEVVIPDSYQAGATFTVRVRAAMITTVSDEDPTASTIDVSVWETTEDGAVGSDLVTTALQGMNSLTPADKDFVVTPTGLLPGDKIIIQLSFAGADVGNAGVIISEVSKLSLLLDQGNASGRDFIGRAVAAAANPTDQVLAHVKAMF